MSTSTTRTVWSASWLALRSVLWSILVPGIVVGYVYWTVWFVWVNVFVIAYEEPSLRRRFGASYEEYTRRVGRGIPSRPAERSA